jgi:hypothetical protein
VALVDEDEDEDKDEAFDDGDVLGREVGRRWEGGRVSDVSEHNAGGGGAAAMAKDEPPRFSNVRHWSRGDNDDNDDDDDDDDPVA